MLFSRRSWQCIYCMESQLIQTPCQDSEHERFFHHLHLPIQTGSMTGTVNATMRVNVTTRTFQDMCAFEGQLKDLGYRIMDSYNQKQSNGPQNIFYLFYHRAKF